ncbi:MAG: sigma-54-dependent Fis family transcriptional regulator [Akkermansiaceae bacterium]|nr:sigma-54-dependent Fis family transcriptional regulator [Verrucomicrobiales bacterium]
MTPTLKTIVVIDDERAIQATLTAILERKGYTVHLGPTASLGRKKIDEMQPDLVLLDLGLPDADGLTVLRELKTAYPALPVMILTANDTLANAIDSIKLGAFHFLSKPCVPEELLSLCSLALEQTALVKRAETLMEANEVLQKRLQAAEDRLAPVAISRLMREVEQLIARVAPSEANILLTGESGVGKEVYASEIHRRSRRAKGPMVKLNCSAFPASMIESELFGYAKGAFTGAVTAFSGMLAEAEGGTLFLDEITEMPVELQTRFLRVLQEREFRPLGTSKSIPADFRLVAASNRPPGQAVGEGRLRQDLYFRLKTFEIEIPPLRDRKEDITKLVDTFLHRFALQLKRAVPQLEPEALELLRSYPWPGNVRELQNAMEHALVLCEGPLLGPRCLPREIQMPALAPTPGATSVSLQGLTLEQLEKQAVIDALRRADGNKKRAAEALGIHRPTLYAMLRRHGIGV